MFRRMLITSRAFIIDPPDLVGMKHRYGSTISPTFISYRLVYDDQRNYSVLITSIFFFFFFSLHTDNKTRHSYTIVDHFTFHQHSLSTSTPWRQKISLDNSRQMAGSIIRPREAIITTSTQLNRAKWPYQATQTMRYARKLSSVFKRKRAGRMILPGLRRSKLWYCIVHAKSYNKRLHWAHSTRDLSTMHIWSARQTLSLAPQDNFLKEIILILNE